MKYITSCPKCETHFLLNDELIKAHRGKVQCGSCEHVFNAKNRLTEVADEVTSADDYQASLESSEQDDVPAPEGDDSAPTIDDIEITADAAAPIERSEIDVTINPDPTTPAEPKHTIDLSNPSTLDDFARSLEKPKKTNKYPILFNFLGLVLILVAASQAVYHLRVQIAAEHPRFKPLLVKACVQLNCTIGLPKQLNLITIGDSDMQEDDNYQSVINFSSSLTNKASYAQTYPNIELTLTGADDKVVIRKLIPPKEYLAASEKVENGLPAREEMAINIALYVNEASVAGYRILLVY